MTTRQDALPARPALAAGARRPRMRGWGERYVQYWLILPALLTMCAVLIYPLVYSLWISFFDWNITSVGRPFLGLRNYVEALTNASSQFIFAQNIAFTVICIALEFVIGMALALLLSRQFVGRGLARTLLLLPMLTAPVLAGFNFRWIFNDRFGLANQLLIQARSATVRLAGGRQSGPRRDRAGDDLAGHSVHDAPAAGRPGVAADLAVRGGDRRWRLRLATLPAHRAARSCGPSSWWRSPCG